MKTLVFILGGLYITITDLIIAHSAVVQTCETNKNQATNFMDEERLGKFSKSVSLDDLQNIFLLVQDPTSWKGEYKMFKLLSEKAKEKFRTIEFGGSNAVLIMKELVEELRPCKSLELLSILTGPDMNFSENSANNSLVVLPALKQVYIRYFSYYIFDWNEIIFFTKNEGGDSVTRRLLAPGLKVTVDLGVKKVQTHLFNFDTGEVINISGPQFPLYGPTQVESAHRTFLNPCGCELNISGPNLAIIHLANPELHSANEITFEYNEILKCNPHLKEFKVFSYPSLYIFWDHITAWINLTDICSMHLTSMSLDGIALILSSTNQTNLLPTTVSTSSLYLMNCILSPDVVNNFGEIFYNLIYLYVDFTPYSTDINQEFNCHDLIYNIILKGGQEEQELNKIGWIFIQTCARNSSQYEIPRVKYSETEEFFQSLGFSNDTQTFVLKKIGPHEWIGEVIDSEAINSIRNKFQQTILSQ